MAVSTRPAKLDLPAPDGNQRLHRMPPERGRGLQGFMGKLARAPPALWRCRSLLAGCVDAAPVRLFGERRGLGAIHGHERCMVPI